MDDIRKGVDTVEARVLTKFTIVKNAPPPYGCQSLLEEGRRLSYGAIMPWRNTRTSVEEDGFPFVKLSPRLVSGFTRLLGRN